MILSLFLSGLGKALPIVLLIALVSSIGGAFARGYVAGVVEPIARWRSSR